jgi:hypothetical protein
MKAMFLLIMVFVYTSINATSHELATNEAETSSGILFTKNFCLFTITSTKLVVSDVEPISHSRGIPFHIVPTFTPVINLDTSTQPGTTERHYQIGLGASMLIGIPLHILCRYVRMRTMQLSPAERAQYRHINHILR